MKASLPFPSLCVFEKKYGSSLFDANDVVPHPPSPSTSPQTLHLPPDPVSPSECKHRNMDMTQKAPDGILGVPFAAALKKIKYGQNVLFLLLV